MALVGARAGLVPNITCQTLLQRLQEFDADSNQVQQRNKPAHRTLMCMQAAYVWDHSDALPDIALNSALVLVPFESAPCTAQGMLTCLIVTAAI